MHMHRLTPCYAAEGDHPGEDEYDPVDTAEVEEEIAAGVKAIAWLNKNTNRNWEHWAVVIKGWRGLRTLAFAAAGTNNVDAQAYRDAMGDLLKQKKYRAYAQYDRPTRSYMSKLCDNIEEVDDWYYRQPIEDRQRWNHPEAIVKHCPKDLLAKSRRDNKSKRGKAKLKKPATTAEEERLRALVDSLKSLLIQVIREWVTDTRAKDELLAKVERMRVTPIAEHDLDDDIPDFGGGGEADDDEPEIKAASDGDDLAIPPFLQR